MHASRQWGAPAPQCIPQDALRASQVHQIQLADADGILAIRLQLVDLQCRPLRRSVLAQLHRLKRVQQLQPEQDQRLKGNTVLQLTCTVTQNTECDRLDCLFSSVAAVRRFSEPVSSSLYMSSALRT